MGGIGVFWDLDNLPPSRADPAGHVEVLRGALGRYGSVMFVSAYGNKATLQYVPRSLRERWKEEEEEFKAMERERSTAKDKGNPKPFVCSFCGNKFATQGKLTNHFKIHTAEQMKRSANLDRKKGKQRTRFFENEYLPKLKKIQDAERAAFPQFLRKQSDVRDLLRLSGVSVVKVPQEDQAADKALIKDASALMNAADGAGKSVCIISDDAGFKPLIERLQKKNYRVLVVSRRDVMLQAGDVGIDHKELFPEDEEELLEEDPEFEELAEYEDMMNKLGWGDDD